MEDLSNYHEDHHNQHENSHKLCNKTGYPVLSLMKSQWKLRQPETRNAKHCINHDLIIKPIDLLKTYFID